MIATYYKTAVRGIARQKLLSLLNIMGLAIGLSGFFVITLFVLHEESYDAFYKNSNLIYRVSPPENARTAPLLSASLKKDIPGIEAAVSVQATNGIIRSGNIFFNEERMWYAGEDFTKIFSYDFVDGIAGNALKEPYSVIVSQTIAKKYFNESAVVGRTLYIQDSIPLKITGVYKDLPNTTHLKTDIVISMATRKIMGARLDTWDINIYYTYVLLNGHSNPLGFQDKLNDFVKRSINVLPNREDYTLEAQPITDIHLKSTKAMEPAPSGIKSTLRIFISIAVFILLIACINYINISSAAASKREKEIGLRKTIGAGKWQIRKQFLAESILIAIFSMLISFIITPIALVGLDKLTGVELSTSDLFSVPRALAIFSFTTVIGLLAGIYPASVLASYNPVSNLNKKNKPGKGKLNFRQALVALQYFLSLILLAGTFIIYQQLDFMKKQSLGFDKEHVLVVPFKWDNKVLNQFENLKQEFLKYPDVKFVTESGDIPGKMATTMSYWSEGMPLDKTGAIQALYTDQDFIATYNMKIIAGRDFSKELIADSNGAYILNEEAVAAFGWKKEEAVGKKITVHNNGTVIGVVQDFHFNSLQQAIAPLVIAVRPDWSGYISMRLSGGHLDKTLNYIEEVWKKTIPGRPFEHYFLDEDFNRQYLAEDRLGKLVGIFSSLAFFIASIGIVGLAIFIIERRTKEIGIRKVLGASVSNIVLLFSKEFFRPVFIAMIFAFPVAWYIMNAWLKDFAYRINVNWTTFLFAGLIACVIAFITVSVQLIKAAIAKPVISLKTE